MGYIFLLSIIFIVIAISRNKNGEYLKQISFTIMIFSILNSIILQRLGDTGLGKAIYFGMEISYGMVSFLFVFSIIITMISLIVYLFADAER